MARKLSWHLRPFKPTRRVASLGDGVALTWRQGVVKRIDMARNL